LMLKTFIIIITGENRPQYSVVNDSLKNNSKEQQLFKFLHCHFLD